MFVAQLLKFTLPVTKPLFLLLLGLALSSCETMDVSSEGPQDSLTDDDSDAGHPDSAIGDDFQAGHPDSAIGDDFQAGHP